MLRHKKVIYDYNMLFLTLNWHLVNKDNVVYDFKMPGVTLNGHSSDREGTSR